MCSPSAYSISRLTAGELLISICRQYQTAVVKQTHQIRAEKFCRLHKHTRCIRRNAITNWLAMLAISIFSTQASFHVVAHAKPAVSCRATVALFATKDFNYNCTAKPFFFFFLCVCFICSGQVFSPFSTRCKQTSLLLPFDCISRSILIWLTNMKWKRIKQA